MEMMLYENSTLTKLFYPPRVNISNPVNDNITNFAEKKGLDPEWLTANQAIRPGTGTTMNDHRPVIAMTDPEDDIDFATLHNVLYFLYTGTVNLHVPLRDQIDEYHFPEGFPEPPDPYCLYRNSDKFLLDTLKQRCYMHLNHGVNHENVSERLFHKDTQHHKELQDLYRDYIIEHYDAVK